ncbi:MAG: DNA cytosine methyltransferase [bacterium]
MIDFVETLSVKDQIKLLKRCIAQEMDLGQELAKRGLEYDSLRYRHNNTGLNLFSDYELRAPYKTPEDYNLSYHGVPTVSFFSGAGGLDFGFKHAGFEHLASIEANEVFCETLRKNNPSWTIIGPPNHNGDARNREELKALLLVKIGVKSSFEGVFHGGPPCQPFSIAANQRFSKDGDNFKRIGYSHKEYGNLLLDFVWYIKEFMPRAFLIENVEGLQTIDSGSQLSEAITMLRSYGYNVTMPTVLNSAEYGVPQNRLRVFVVGVRSSYRYQFPQRDDEMVPCGRAFEKHLNSVTNHVTRQHKAESIIRYMELRYGERDDLGRVDRLNPKLPSKTVIAGGTKGGGRSHLHPQIPRTLSVRESARLQTFPDSYIFHGSPARQFTQVGNAVPPLLAMKLARSIYENIYD